MRKAIIRKKDIKSNLKTINLVSKKIIAVIKANACGLWKYPARDD